VTATTTPFFAPTRVRFGRHRASSIPPATRSCVSFVDVCLHRLRALVDARLRTTWLGNEGYFILLKESVTHTGVFEIYFRRKIGKIGKIGKTRGHIICECSYRVRSCRGRPVSTGRDASPCPPPFAAPGPLGPPRRVVASWLEWEKGSVHHLRCRVEYLHPENASSASSVKRKMEPAAERDEPATERRTAGTRVSAARFLLLVSTCFVPRKK